MRIVELNLMAFGPFTDRRIDLSGGEFGLHLIYGANEAGKSSSLRAITDFLFGFPARSPDNFLHANNELRVGATLQHRDGKQLKAVRRKANQKSLRGDGDDQPVEDHALAQFIGNIDRDLFCAMFGINHDLLRSGGREITAGKGRLGELLFSAGAGLVDLRATHRSLLDDSEALLKSSGRSGAIHEGLLQLTNLKKTAAQAEVSVEAWQQQRTCLATAQKHQMDVDNELGILRRQHERLTRFEKSLTAIAIWKTQFERCQSLQHVPRLEKDFARRAQELMLQLRAAETQHQESEKRLLEVQSLLGQVTISSELLEISEAMEDLRDQFGPYRKSLQDRPGVVAKRDTYEQEVLQLMSQLGQPADLNEVAKRFVSSDRKVKINQLGARKIELAERLKSAQLTRQKLCRQIQQLEQQLAETPEVGDLQQAKADLQFILKQGDLEKRLEEIQQAQARTDRQLAAAFKRLPLWQGSLEELERVAVPAEATIDRWESELQLHRQTLVDIARQKAEQQQNLDSVDRELKELEVQFAIPTEPELHTWRARRNDAWRWIRSQLNGETIDSQKSAEFLSSFDSGGTLEEALTRSIGGADRIADRLRIDAKRVAMKQKLLLENGKVQQKLQRLENDRLQVENYLQQSSHQWQQVWQALGVAPLSPREMSDWLRQYQTVIQLQDELRGLQSEQKQIERKIDEMKTRIVRTLLVANLSDEFHSSKLGILVVRLNEFCEHQQRLSQRRDRLDAELNSWRLQIEETELLIDAAEKEAQQVSVNWTREMDLLGLEHEALPAQADARLETIAEMRDRKKDADRYRQRVENIDRDAEQFESDVAVLAIRFISDTSHQTTDQNFQALRKVFEANLEAAKLQKSLTEQKIELLQKEAESRNTLASHRTQLEQMMRLAKVESLDRLLDAARESQERIAAEESLRNAEHQVANFSNGLPLPEFVIEVESERDHAQTIEFRIQQLNEKIDKLSEERDQVMREVTAAEIELGRFDGSGTAADSAALVESAVTKLDEQLHSLAVLKLASAVLAAGIERHREKNQGPVLARASQIFREITLGHFDGLRADYNEKGEPIVAGLRNGSLDGRGGLVAVDGMSDGTCDQLFLALRLASLETWLQHHQPMPLIVDDILLNFDDARSLATLKVLAELSRQTQIIFFTHHRHLLELAEDNLSFEELFTTRLEQGATADKP